MAITTKEQLLKVLRAFNPWWTTGAVHPSFLKEYRRFAYYEAMNRLEQKDIRRTVVLTGTRRVGKTTIEYQMIDTLIERGVSPAQIVFISLDHPMLKLSNLSDILDCYHENVWPTQDVYYFFDEMCRYGVGKPRADSGWRRKRRGAVERHSGSHAVILRILRIDWSENTGS